MNYDSGTLLHHAGGLFTRQKWLHSEDIETSIGPGGLVFTALYNKESEHLIDKYIWIASSRNTKGETFVWSLVADGDTPILSKENRANMLKAFERAARVENKP